MTLLAARILMALCLLLPLPALSDPVTSGWSMGLSCSPKGPYGSGAMVASNAGGFGAAGTCSRGTGLFSKLVFASYTGGSLRSTTVHSLQTPSVLITPPLLTTESQPIFSLAPACPISPSQLDLNWLFVQWTDTERRAMTNTYLSGTATYSATLGVFITGQYDVSGSPVFLGRRSMPGLCNSGVYAVNGSLNPDIDGSIYFNAAGMGAFKTSAGRATFFFPRFTVTAATHFGSKAFRGLVFDSDSANGVGDVRQVRGSADAPGTQFTLQPLSDPENDIIDSGGTTYTDTLTFLPGNINSPQAGMLHGTLVRTGYGAGSGRVSCIANGQDGDILLMCSGESPSDNSLPFHLSLYAESLTNKAQGLNGYIAKMARDTSTGKLYVGGGFTGFSGGSTSLLASLNSDGSLDTDFNPGTGINGSAVLSVALDAPAGKVYAAGDFSSFNGTTRNNIVRVNLDGTLDTSYAPDPTASGFINDIALAASGKLYVAGYFSSINSISRGRIARLNSDGTVDTTFDPGSGFNNWVQALAIDASSGKIYAVGNFSTFNGTGRNYIARLNTDGTLDTGFNPGTGFDNSTTSVTVDASSGKIYVGGSFSSFNGTGRSCIARLNTDGTVDTGFNPGTGFNNFWVGALAVDSSSGKLYAGGRFTTFNGTGRNYVARVNSDGTLDTGFNPGTGFSSYVESFAIDASSGKVYAGGSFVSFNGTGRNYLARLNTDGTLDTAVGVETGFIGAVNALAFDAVTGKVFAGGDFTSFSGVSRNRIARLGSDGGLDTGFNPGTGFNNSVQALAFDGSSGKVFAGGSFTSFNGTGRNRVARLNSDGTLDTGFNPGTGFNNSVQALAFDASSGKIYAGGDFTSFNGTGINRIARLNSDGSLDTTFGPGSGFNSSVASLAFDAVSGNLSVGGAFSTFNGTGRNCIARLGANGTLDTSFDPGSGADGTVFTLALDASSKLYAGGNFTSMNGTGRNRITRLNSDGTVDTGFNPGTGFDFAIRAVVLSGGSLCAVGDFAHYNGTWRGSAARLNLDGTLETGFDTGSGFNNLVFALVVDPASGKLITGGNSSSYSHYPINNFVRLTYSGAVD